MSSTTMSPIYRSQQVFRPSAPARRHRRVCRRRSFTSWYINDGKARIQGAERVQLRRRRVVRRRYEPDHREKSRQRPALATIPTRQLPARQLTRPEVDRGHALDGGGGKPLNRYSAGSGRLGLVPVFDHSAYNLVNIYLNYQPIPNVVAAVSVENLLNVDYTKYMCCSTAAGYVVPSRYHVPGFAYRSLRRKGIADRHVAAIRRRDHVHRDERFRVKGSRSVREGLAHPRNPSRPRSGLCRVSSAQGAGRRGHTLYASHTICKSKSAFRPGPGRKNCAACAAGNETTGPLCSSIRNSRHEVRQTVTRKAAVA